MVAPDLAWMALAGSVGSAEAVILALMAVGDGHQTFIPFGDAEGAVCRRFPLFASSL